MTRQLAVGLKSTKPAKNGLTRKSFSSAFQVSQFLCISNIWINHSDWHHIGAFTPGCQERHLPSYIKNLEKFRSKGIDIVAVIAFNDSFVMVCFFFFFFFEITLHVIWSLQFHSTECLGQSQWSKGGWYPLSGRYEHVLFERAWLDYWKRSTQVSWKL